MKNLALRDAAAPASPDDSKLYCAGQQLKPAQRASFDGNNDPCQHPRLHFNFAISALWIDRDWPGEQDNYVNAVIAIDTTLTAPKLLATLQSIESQHHRQREIRWAARTLDLDLLLYGTANIQTPELIVPHPRMFSRDFVLRPLADIAPAELLRHYLGENTDIHYSDNDNLWVLAPNDKAITP